VNFGFTEEQQLLRRQIRRFLDDRCPLAEVRRLMETDAGYSQELWREMSGLAWVGLTVPEEFGGAGLGWVDLLIVLEETGRTLFPSPLIATTLASAALLRAGSESQQRRFLPALADGSAIGTLAIHDDPDTPGPGGITMRGTGAAGGLRVSGTKRVVMDPEAATLAIVGIRTGEAPEEIALALIDCSAPGVHAEAFPTMDRTKRLGNLTLTDVTTDREALLCSGPAAVRMLDVLESLGAVAVTGEAVGAAEGAHALTVVYARDRRQFGRPIGQYQGVKHPLAEMYVDIESFKSLVYFAAWAADREPAALPRAASCAKAYAAEAFARIGIDGVQLHGAVGYTDEFDIQLYLKRAKWVRPAFGDADHHYDRVATLGAL
jgi:acyl-CoA dehydrogenase